MDDPKKISLQQAMSDAEHAAKILREKVGDVRTLTGAPAPAVAVETATADQKQLEQRVVSALKTIFDPEIPLNIYDLGLIYRLVLDATNAVKIEMTLTAPGCPVAGEIVAEVKRKVETLPEVPRVEVELVWDPPWTRERLSEAARLDLGML
jgi:FeS assembly SUF system protein